jgi:hypothetical protein
MQRKYGLHPSFREFETCSFFVAYGISFQPDLLAGNDCKVEVVPANDQGLICLDNFKKLLLHYKKYPYKIAAITGLLQCNRHQDGLSFHCPIDAPKQWFLFCGFCLFSSLREH